MSAGLAATTLGRRSDYGRSYLSIGGLKTTLDRTNYEGAPRRVSPGACRGNLVPEARPRAVGLGHAGGRLLQPGGGKTIRIGSAAADCANLVTMVEFGSNVLGYRVMDEGEGWTYLDDPQSRGPGLFLQQMPDPTPGKNRWHLDLDSRDEEREAARLEGLGATRLGKFEAYEGAIKGTTLIVMRDVEGNEFVSFVTRVCAVPMIRGPVVGAAIRLPIHRQLPPGGCYGTPEQSSLRLFRIGQLSPPIASPLVPHRTQSD